MLLNHIIQIGYGPKKEHAYVWDGKGPMKVKYYKPPHRSLVELHLEYM